MKRLQLDSATISTARAATMAILLACGAAIGKTDVPVFLLAGQSNMSGYASANDLTADQKPPVDNVKIYADMTWEGDDSKERKWLTLGPGFGSGAGKIGPELALGRTLSEKLPNIKIAFIKVCCGSTYLGNYTQKPNDCWVPPSSNNGNAGAHYKRMLTSIEAALKAFTTAFDTSQYTPQWAGFVWLQGEFDGQVRELADAYEKNLTNLISDVRKDLKLADLPVIIPMIDVQSSWPYNGTVRNAEIAVTKKLENVDTMDTKGLPTDGAHYKAAGYITIGRICAQRWLDMDFNYSGKVPVVYQHRQPYNAGMQLTRQTPTARVFDISGRCIGMTRQGLSRSMSEAMNSKLRGVYIVTAGTGNGPALLRVEIP